MLQSPWACRPFFRLAALAFHVAFAATLAAQESPIRDERRPDGPGSGPHFDSPTDMARFLSPPTTRIYLHSIPRPAAVPLLFLPPDLPVLDTPIPLRSPLDNGVFPPVELAAYVSDLFYPQLAARLAADDLPRRLRVKLDAYRQQRQTLLEELRVAIASARDLEREPRRAALAESALRQARGLADLDTVAEQLRIELATDSILPYGPQPFTPREHEPPRQPGATDSRVLQSAAFFAEGLSADQRRLLRAAAAEAGQAATPDAIFVAPEGGSIRVPMAHGTPAANALSSYADTRRALTRALLRAFEQPPGDGPAAWADLAALQAPAFAALETQAEEIRLALQDVHGIDGLPSAPALPAELAARLATYRDHKKALLRELNASLAGIVRTSVAPTSNGVSVPVSAFSKEQQAALAALSREKDSLRDALAEHRRASGATQDRKSVDNLLEDFERARQAQELRERYADYRTALLEPGLSPAQRRLLLASALQSLDFPLPSGEPIHAP